MLGSSGSNCTMRRRFIPRRERMDSEEPPNVRVACSGDIDEVVRLMHDAAAWMSAKERPHGTSRGSTGHSRRPSS